MGGGGCRALQGLWMGQLPPHLQVQAGGERERGQEKLQGSGNPKLEASTG